MHVVARKDLKMGSCVAFTKIALLFIFLLSASLLSTSFAVAGMTKKPVGRPEGGTCTVATKEMPNESFQDGEDARGVHRRDLMVRTDDYGRYDPPPAFVQPPPKTIPN